MGICSGIVAVEHSASATFDPRPGGKVTGGEVVLCIGNVILELTSVLVRISQGKKRKGGIRRVNVHVAFLVKCILWQVR